MDDLDKLIAALETGDPNWNADFMDYMTDLEIYPQPSLLVLQVWNGSLDAAKRLHIALLPGWAWDVCDDGEAKVWEYVDRFYPPQFVGVCRDNPARAWFLAILRARKACFSDCKP